MVELQILDRGITDEATLRAMRVVPRHEFLPPEAQHLAYLDGAQPIHEMQTISQPYIVALMTSSARLTPESRVLEIGTGSGYQAAVLSRICHHVCSIERIPQLAHEAQDTFAQLGYNNIEVKIEDGSLGWKEKAPFDAILVTAASPSIPQALIEQLAEGGFLVIPVGERSAQRLIRVEKKAGGKLEEELLELVRFVPLIGEQGW